MKVRKHQCEWTIKALINQVQSLQDSQTYDQKSTVRSSNQNETFPAIHFDLCFISRPDLSSRFFYLFPIVQSRFFLVIEFPFRMPIAIHSFA